MAYTAATNGVIDTLVVPVQATCTECQDSFTWLAVYKDGTTLPECNGSGEHAAFAHIDLSRLETLMWLPLVDGLPQISVRMTDASMRPILFRRRLLEFNTGNRTTIHCLGWQSTEIVNGVPHNTQSFTFIFDDGNIVISNDRNAV